MYVYILFTNRNGRYLVLIPSYVQSCYYFRLVVLGETLDRHIFSLKFSHDASNYFNSMILRLGIHLKSDA